MRAFSPLYFLGKPVADFISFFVDIGGMTLNQEKFT